MTEDNKPLYLKKSDILKDMPILCDTVAYPMPYREDVSSSQLSTHEIHEIDMIVSGNGIHCVLNQTIPCKTGDVYITCSNVPHCYFTSNEDAPLIVKRIFFDPKDWFSPAVSTVGEPRYCYGVFSDNAVLAYAMLNAQTHEETELLFQAIHTEILEQKNEWHDAVGAYLTQLLIQISRYINGAIKNIPCAPSKEWNTVLSTIRTVMATFDDPSLTLETIANTLYISKSHLSRLFKKLVGESFSDYLRQVRMDQACRLLRETKMSTEDIVFRCGLRDMQSFYRNFHTMTGMTPHQYRTEQNPIRSANVQNGDEIGSLIEEISTRLQKGKASTVRDLIGKALDMGADPNDIMNNGLLRGMSVIGEKFKNNEIYVPEVLVSARAMNLGVQTLCPYLSEKNAVVKGRVCLGTVQGDLHDIGKNLVRLMMEGKGLEVIDLGVDVAPETFVQTAIEKNCDIIACSALLTTTMGVMADVVKECKKAGIRRQVRIMVGGAPVTEEFCNEIGADIYTADAYAAAEAAIQICMKKK